MKSTILYTITLFAFIGFLIATGQYLIAIGLNLVIFHLIEYEGEFKYLNSQITKHEKDILELKKLKHDR